MPLCISCRGEYWTPGKETHATEETDPTRKRGQLWENDEDQAQSSTTSSPNLIQLYSLKDLPPFICARCGQNNERWHRWATASGLAHFDRFFFRSIPWGWLVLSSFLLPVIAALALNFTPVASERIAFPLALLLIFVNVALLYTLKDTLWRYELWARVSRTRAPQLALLSVGAFVLAVVFGLIIIFMMESHGVFAETQPAEAASTEGATRVISTLLLAMTFVNVTLSALAMAGHDYARWLNREMPQPLYAQERRLLNVIVDSLPAKLKQTMGQDKRIETTIVDLERTRDAGMMIKISTESKVGAGSSQTLLRQLQNWRIEADRWGRIVKMEREGTPHYIVAERTSGNGALEADELIFAERN